MRKSFVTATLAANVSGHQIHVEITFANKTDQKLYLYRPNVCERGLVENNVFVVRRDGQSVKYIGKYVKRRSPTREDYREIAPSEQVTETVHLNKYYQLEGHPGEYKVRYEATHGTPVDASALFEVVSNEVMFKLG